MVTLAVIVAVFNEEKHIPDLLNALISQSKQPDEIIVVDDGSTDRTADILSDFAQKHSHIKIFAQVNAGPAAARNLGWKKSNSDICVFTDGDCVPQPDWLEKLTGPFDQSDVGAAAGTYKTMNSDNVLARFIGWEIAWRHSRIKDTVDAHGSYNLAVRKSILVEMNGFKEIYKKPSGEDWDLTYRISQKYKIAFVRDAVVGHYHPVCLAAYLKNQWRRGFDRIMLYKDHPAKRSGDSYTGNFDKYQVLAAGLTTVSSILFFIPGMFLIHCFSFLALLLCSFAAFFYIRKRDCEAAWWGVSVSFMRSFFWFFGAVAGFFVFYIHKNEGV